MKSTIRPSFSTGTRTNDQGKRNFGSGVDIQQLFFLAIWSLTH